MKLTYIPDMDMKETFGQRIRRLRMSKGLSQAQLADRVGITRPHMNVIEKDGVRRPNTDTIEKLEAILGPIRDQQRQIREMVANAIPPQLERVPFLVVNDFRAGLVEVNLYGVITNGELHRMSQPEPVLAGEERAPDPSKQEVLVRVRDESLREWGIGANDYLVLRLCEDTKVATGDLILVNLNGQHMARRWMWREDSRTLENAAGEVTHVIGEHDDLEIVAVLHRSYPMQLHSKPIH